MHVCTTTDTYLIDYHKQMAGNSLLSLAAKRVSN